MISDTILKQQKPQNSSKDISVLCVLIFERVTNFLTAPQVSLNGTAEAGPTAELITETAETMIRQFSGTEKQKAK